MFSLKRHLLLSQAQSNSQVPLVIALGTPQGAKGWRLTHLSARPWMLPYVLPLRNKKKGQCPDGKGLTHPRTGRPWRKAVMRPSRCLGQPRTAEAGLEEQLGTWRPAQWRRSKGRLIAPRPYTCPLLSGPQSTAPSPAPAGQQARAAGTAQRARAERTGPGSRSRPRPATHLSSAITMASNRSWPPAMAAARPPSAPELRHTELASPDRDHPLPRMRSPLPEAAARGRPGKDGAREGPAGAGAGRGRVRGGGAEPSWAGSRPRPPPPQ